MVLRGRELSRSRCETPNIGVAGKPGENGVVAVRLMVPVVGGLGDLTVERRHVINALLGYVSSAFRRALARLAWSPGSRSQKVRGCLCLVYVNGLPHWPQMASRACGPTGLAILEVGHAYPRSTPWQKSLRGAV